MLTPEEAAKQPIDAALANLKAALEAITYHPNFDPETIGTSLYLDIQMTEANLSYHITQFLEEDLPF